WVRAGVSGASLVAAAFILPSFVMVMLLSFLYVRFGGLAWMQGLFYGGAAVIAIIARSVLKLVKMTLAKDRLLWAVFTINAVATAWTETEIAWLFLLSGIAALAVHSRPRIAKSSATLAWLPWPWLVSGLKGAASSATLVKICLYFAEAGAFVFGSGLAIVPFLHGGV